MILSWPHHHIPKLQDLRIYVWVTLISLLQPPVTSQHCVTNHPQKQCLEATIIYLYSSICRSAGAQQIRLWGGGLGFSLQSRGLAGQLCSKDLSSCSSSEQQAKRACCSHGKGTEMQRKAGTLKVFKGLGSELAHQHLCLILSLKSPSWNTP